jgi:hypothetical protein
LGFLEGGGANYPKGSVGAAWAEGVRGLFDWGLYNLLVLAGDAKKDEGKGKGKGFEDHPEVQALQTKFLDDKEKLCQSLLDQWAEAEQDQGKSADEKADVLKSIQKKLELVLKQQDDIQRKIEKNIPSDTSEAGSAEVKEVEEENKECNSSDSEWGLEGEDLKIYQQKDSLLERMVEYQTKLDKAEEITKQVQARKEERKRKREKEEALKALKEEEAASKDKKIKEMEEKSEQQQKEVADLKEKMEKQEKKIQKMKEKEKQRELCLQPKAAAKGRKSGSR